VIWLTARTDVDKERGLVTLHDIKVPRVSFPASPGRNQDFLRIARQHVPAGVRTIALDQLEATSPSAGRRRRRPRRCPS
jgi:hypothetical protein